MGPWIVDRAVHLHQDLARTSPGLLETVYEVTFAAKRSKRGLSVERQVPTSIESEPSRFDERFRGDFIVETKGDCGTQVSRKG
jgi:GxxExxY protein